MPRVRPFGRVFLALALLCIALIDTRLRADEAAAQAAPTMIRRVRTGKPAEIYDQGEKLRWGVTLLNPSETSPLEARLFWTATPWRPEGEDRVGPPSSGDLPVAVAPGKSTVAVLEFTPSARGWHEVTLELRNAAGILLDRQVRTFSVGSTPRSTGAFFRYGVCTHMRREIGTPFFDKEVALAGRLGIDSIRTELAEWGSTEPAEGRFDFSKPDFMLAALDPLGIKVESILAYSTRWGSSGNPDAKDWNEWNKSAPRPEPWRAYVQKVIERYGDRVGDWEVWNEPDIGFWRSTTGQYVELFNSTAALIKDRAPKARVLNGGLAMVRRPPNLDFVEKFVAAADQSRWDVFAYHDYHTFSQFLTRRDEVGAHLAPLRAGMPLWINEGGFHTLLSGGEREQAVTLVKKMTTAPARGISAYFWYNLRDDGLSPRDPEHHFGLTHHDGQPKPAFAAYQALIRELGAARYVGSPPSAETPEGVWAHLYELSAKPAGPDAPTHTLVLWREGSSGRTPIWLGTKAESKVTGAADLMGNPAKIALASRGAALALSREPLYIHLRADGGRPPVFSIRPLVDAPAVLVLVPGEPASFEFGLRNPIDVPATARLSLSSDLPGLSLPTEARSLPLAPGASIREKIRLQLPAGPAAAGSHALTLHLAIPEAGFELPARIPLVLATLVPRLGPGGQIDGLPALARLEAQTDVHNLYSAEPNPLMQWRGPEDLSAVARVARDDTALHLQVVVRDDVHRQTDLGDNLWAGDSLQVGIRGSETATGYIELGLSLDDEGRSGGWVFSTQKNARLPLGKIDSALRYSVVREESAGTTTYRLSIPWATLGSAGPLPEGFRLTFIANDNDGHGRKQWVKLTDGLGDEKNPDRWALFSCR